MTTKKALTRDVVPVLRGWLEANRHVRFHEVAGLPDGTGDLLVNDQADHAIYAFGPGREGPAYIVYEGAEWTWDFIDAMDGEVLEGPGGRVYEIEAVSSYELNVVSS